MKFEAGKYYKHTTGDMLHTLVMIDTTMWGHTLLAERCPVNAMNELVAVGTDSESYAENYEEITEAEWLTAFSNE